MQKRKNQSLLETEIRRRVEAKFDERNGVLIHLLSYVGVNIMVWAIWLFTAAGFPWPLFVTFFWGIGLAGHLLDYYHKYGGGAQKREERIQEEVLRQMQRLYEREERLRGHEAGEAASADVYELDHFEPRGLRLSDDGELVNHDFGDEEEAEQRHEKG